MPKIVKFFMFLEENKMNGTVIYKITGWVEDLFYISFVEN